MLPLFPIYFKKLANKPNKNLKRLLSLLAFMKNYPKLHLKLALLLGVFFATIVASLPDTRTNPLIAEQSLPSEKLNENKHLAKVKQKISTNNEVHSENRAWSKITVKTGDNLALIFKNNNLPASDLQAILKLGNPVSSLKKILPGQELTFKTGSNGELAAMRYKKNAFDTLLLDRHNYSFRASWESATPKKIVAYKSAKITKESPSLYQAGKAVGLSDNIIMKLSYLYQWDISFALDLRKGDSFDLIFEEIYVDDMFVGEGNIIAATFSNMGKRHEVVKYTNLKGHSDYYTPEGLSIRKAFLRDPVHFSHVSSSFNLRRFHPIHKKVMPHRGIDYAAKKGTPVLASGNGRIVSKKKNRASGNYLVIQHGERYTTKYLHLSTFEEGIRQGKTVKQGQTIGYVGATGWATAPHLHYEFLVSGVHRNPKTVSLPKASPINKEEMELFRAQISPLLSQLESISSKDYASIASPIPRES